MDEKITEKEGEVTIRENKSVANYIVSIYEYSEIVSIYDHPLRLFLAQLMTEFQDYLGELVKISQKIFSR